MNVCGDSCGEKGEREERREREEKEERGGGEDEERGEGELESGGRRRERRGGERERGSKGEREREESVGRGLARVKECVWCALWEERKGVSLIKFKTHKYHLYTQYMH